MNLRKMPEWLFVIAFAVLLPGHLSAQITITAQDFLNLIGSRQVVLEEENFSTPVDVGPPGANQTWDFRSMVITDTIVVVSEFLSPGQTVSALTFPEANVVEKISFGDSVGFESFNFYNFTNSDFINLGDSTRFSSMGLDTSFVFFQNDTLAPLPIAFGNTWMTFETDTTGFFPAFASISNDTTMNTVDGWGTLRIPLGDFQCLRLKQEGKTTNQDILNGGVISTSTETFIQYNWIGLSSFLLLSIQSQDGETNPDFTDARGIGVLDTTTTAQPGNTAPMAVADDYDLDEDTTINVSAPGVLDNDSDPNGDALTAAVNTGPSNGTLTLNGNGSFIYTPNTNFNGSDSFTYNASDGNGGTATGTASLTVNPVNDAPGPYDLLGPGNNTETDTLNPTLNWARSEDVDAGDSVSYGVVVSTQSDFSDTVDTAAKFTSRAISFVVRIEDTTFTVANGLQPGQDYYWKVTAFDNSGAMTESNSAFKFRTSDTATNVEGGNSDLVPKAFSLSQNFPNPFNPETVIQYELVQNGLVKLTIFNLLGEKVRTLVDQDQRPGAYQITWNGLDDNGNRTSSGLYVYRLTSGASHQTRRMILLR